MFKEISQYLGTAQMTDNSLQIEIFCTLQIGK